MIFIKLTYVCHLLLLVYFSPLYTHGKQINLSQNLSAINNPFGGFSETPNQSININHLNPKRDYHLEPFISLPLLVENEKTIEASDPWRCLSRDKDDGRTNTILSLFIVWLITFL